MRCHVSSQLALGSQRLVDDLGMVISEMNERSDEVRCNHCLAEAMVLNSYRAMY